MKSILITNIQENGIVKKGKEYEGTVIRIDFPNKGVIEIEDEKVSVKEAIMGQKVRFVIKKARKGKSEGRLLEVVEKSPIETESPQCKHFGPCGGCTYQTLPYDVQLEIKANQVKRLIDQVCKGYEFEGIKASPVRWAYRNKMEFSFGDEIKDGPLALGLHKKGSFHDIITASDCKIVDEDFNKILTCVLDYCTNLKLSFHKKLTPNPILRIV
jgi:tRNA/tmRNA/rRNA uracil-C5-methylase (TrmA/RlmC/RlmD family)